MGLGIIYRFSSGSESTKDLLKISWKQTQKMVQQAIGKSGFVFFGAWRFEIYQTKIKRTNHCS
jgi:hypothetical protein